MSFNKQIKFARSTQAVAAAVLAAQFFAVHSDPANAQLAAQAPATQPSAVLQQSPAGPVAAAGIGSTANPAGPGSGTAANPVVATAPTSSAPSAACSARAELARFARPLIHTMRRLANGQPLAIVAIGSSSTAGAGAS